MIDDLAHNRNTCDLRQMWLEKENGLTTIELSLEIPQEKEGFRPMDMPSTCLGDLVSLVSQAASRMQAILPSMGAESIKVLPI